MNVGRILAIVGFVVIGTGVLMIIFLPDTSRGTTTLPVVNGYGVFLLIIGIFVFFARNLIVVKTTSFEEGIVSRMEDVKNKKGKSKLKPIIILLGLVALMLFLFV